MKSLYVTLTASLLLASLPMSLATHSGCESHPAEEGIAHPLSKGRYLFVDPTRPEKTGEWTDTNRVGGLQTSSCVVGSTTAYRADLQAKTLP